MPPSGGKPDVINGNEGDDWKCRSVLGRLKDWVGGMESAGRFLVGPGVSKDKLRFACLRLGGVGGLMKAGEAGADVLSCLGSSVV